MTDELEDMKNSRQKQMEMVAFQLLSIIDIKLPICYCFLLLYK